MNQNRCPECGALVAGGRAGCQTLFDELAAESYEKPGYMAVYQLAFDAYCMQHPGKYCVSAKSYAAHLTRLCCGLEHNGDPRVYAAIPRWLNGAAPVRKPQVLDDRGRVTVAVVRAARTAEEHATLVREWAESVWDAYAVQHDIARAWIEAALSAQPTLGRLRGAEPRTTGST